MKILITLSLISLIFLNIIFPLNVLAVAFDIGINAHVPGCGDQIIQTGEECDGGNFNGKTCQDFSFSAGSLICSETCEIDFSQCFFVPPPLPPSSGGAISGGHYMFPLPVLPDIKDEILKSADFNKDGNVDFVDLSILLYWFDKTGDQIYPYDLNDDGKIDLMDLSILLFYWRVSS